MLSSFVIFALSSVALGDISAIQQALQANNDTTILASLLNAAPQSLQSILGDANKKLTVYAPSNDALGQFSTMFPQLVPQNLTAPLTDRLVNILSYHVSPETQYVFAGANATQTNTTIVSNSLAGDEVIIAFPPSSIKPHWTIEVGPTRIANVTTSIAVGPNQVINVVDAVLMPPMSAVTTANATIAKLFVELLQEAEFTATINNLTNITIIAPIDAAIDGTMKALNTTPAAVASRKGFLTSILDLHIIQGVFYSTNVSELFAATKSGISRFNVTTALNGTQVTVVQTQAGVSIVGPANNVDVVVADLAFKGGVLHLVNSILFPGNNTMQSIINSSIANVPSFSVDGTPALGPQDHKTPSGALAVGPSAFLVTLLVVLAALF